MSRRTRHPRRKKCCWCCAIYIYIYIFVDQTNRWFDDVDDEADGQTVSIHTITDWLAKKSWCDTKANNNYHNAMTKGVRAGWTTKHVNSPHSVMDDNQYTELTHIVGQTPTKNAKKRINQTLSIYDLWCFTTMMCFSIYLYSPRGYWLVSMRFNQIVITTSGWPKKGPQDGFFFSYFFSISDI